jgi:hypothetical protein
MGSTAASRSPSDPPVAIGGPVQQLTPADEFNAYPEVAHDGADVSVAMWGGGQAHSKAVVARTPRTGQLGPPEKASGDGALSVHLRCQRARRRSGRLGNRTHRRQRASTWPRPLPPAGAEQELSPASDNAGEARPVVAPDGRTTVVWTQVPRHQQRRDNRGTRTNNGPASAFSPTRTVSV